MSPPVPRFPGSNGSRQAVPTVSGQRFPVNGSRFPVNGSNGSRFPTCYGRTRYCNFKKNCRSVRSNPYGSSNALYPCVDPM
jgi:hypothetical protein